MSAYVIAQVDITNPQQYEEYRRFSSIAIQAHGAEICVRGGAVTVLEGPEGWHPGRVVVLKFPDVAAARRFYDSPEYKTARDARAGAAVMKMMVVEGL